MGRWSTDGDGGARASLSCRCRLRSGHSSQRDALRRLAVPTMVGRWVERASASQAGW
jgi:hypothetical protein